MYKHYLACLCKGTSIFAWQTIAIPSRDVNIANLILPNTYAYFFFDTDSSVDPSTLTPRQILNRSNITYLGGELYTFGEVKKMVVDGEKQIAITPIPGTPIWKSSQMTHILKTSAGSWIPFFEDDVLITI